MKNKYTKILLLSALNILLVSCGGTNKTFDVASYGKELSFTGDSFKVMQLTDIHLTKSADNIKVMDYLVNNIKTVNPNLIVFTGDTFMNADSSIVDYFVKRIDDCNVPWAYTFGNHDFQGDYGENYISQRIQSTSTKNALFIDNYGEDGLSGHTNYYINIKSGTDVAYRLYMIDGGNDVNVFFGITGEYDYIKEDQLQHITKINTTLNDGATGLAFFHIPLLEMQTAWNTCKDDATKCIGKNEEKSCPSYKNSEAFEHFKANGIKGYFCGHDHDNYASIDYDGLIQTYGVKSSDLCYLDLDMPGYTTINLHSDGSFALDDIEKVFVKYE